VSEAASAPAAPAIDPPIVERLGDGVVLEMAPIPGGEFVMGAPPGVALSAR
jgi:hypothetical protein